jgi:HlyD family secretion protein
LLRDGKPQSVSVRVGLSDGNLTELVDGDLHEGDALIIDAAATDAQPEAAAPASPGGMRRLF